MVTLKQIMYNVMYDDKLSEEVRERIWIKILKAISQWKNGITDSYTDITDKGQINQNKGDNDYGNKQ